VRAQYVPREDVEKLVPSPGFALPFLTAIGLGALVWEPSPRPFIVGLIAWWMVRAILHWRRQLAVTEAKVALERIEGHPEWKLLAIGTKVVALDGKTPRVAIPIHAAELLPRKVDGIAYGGFADDRRDD
jgi:hypothetical protein